MTATDMMKAFRAAREDNSIRAVVFRVNSPGGSSLASELIRREVELTARKKPVVVSMSGYAASGGYWVSAPAARIVAEPGTITGSIGVFGGKFNLGPAAAKIYLNSGAISRGANVEMFDEFTDFTPQQRAQFESTFIGDTYHYFLKIVAAGRKMSVEDVDQIAQGRVWTGSQAIKLKLVDELGGLNDAIAAAKRIARIPVDQEVPIVSMPQQPSILDAIMSGKLSAALSPPPAASLFARPLEQIIAAAIRGGGAYVAAYCPVVPVL
jgi:protease-4